LSAKKKPEDVSKINGYWEEKVVFDSIDDKDYE
jgi:hypothetical protein